MTCGHPLRGSQALPAGSAAQPFFARDVVVTHLQSGGRANLNKKSQRRFVVQNPGLSRLQLGEAEVQ